MPKDLLIVESPAKTRTLAGFLGSSFQIMASMGHVRDLPKSKLGVDVEDGFEPSYTVIPERKQIISDLKKAAKEARTVYLATDPDREGEAIAWHLFHALDLKNARRIEFNEITQRAVREALDHPREINSARVNAQQARRVLDRLVGYKISPLLWKKVQKNLSAGRVQSVAVRLVVEREREITAFVPVEYWSLTAKLTPTDKEFPFAAKLIEQGGKKIELHTEAETNAVLAGLQGATWKVGGVKKREQKRNPAAPFITSTLQQEAARKLGFSARRTMQTAQQLYEGIELGEEGHVGLITYMRTDSVQVSQEAQAQAREYIQTSYGPEYVPKTPRQYKSKKGAQEAHEAIRPTSVPRRPESLKGHLSSDQFRLYQLIWQRFLASQMESAVFDVTSVDIRAADYTFRATGSVVKFPGFTVLYTEGRDDAAEEDEARAPLPALTVDQLLKLLELLPRQHFTEPPPRYSEASLVKALEDRGIGRPSTYASIISVILDRNYVTLEEKRFRPTELGTIVNDLLVKHFPRILDVDFTAGVEEELDDIAGGEREWVEVLREFYDPFQEALTTAETQMERVKPQPKETDQVCPKCGKPMLLRQGRFGEFLGCSGYPECKTIINPNKTEPVATGVGCPRSGCTGQIVEKRSKRGKTFYGCNRYPECDFATWDKPTDQQCTTCGYPMGERSFRGKSSGMRCINKECPTNVTNGKEEGDGLPTMTDERKKPAAARGKRTPPATAASSTRAKTTKTTTRAKKT
jgi:DNA topoisomerase I